jgi:hypothetical protein
MDNDILIAESLVQANKLRKLVKLIGALAFIGLTSMNEFEEIRENSIR